MDMRESLAHLNKLLIVTPRGTQVSAKSKGGSQTQATSSPHVLKSNQIGSTLAPLQNTK